MNFVVGLSGCGMTAGGGIDRDSILVTFDLKYSLNSGASWLGSLSEGRVVGDFSIPRSPFTTEYIPFALPCSRLNSAWQYLDLASSRVFIETLLASFHSV